MLRALAQAAGFQRVGISGVELQDDEAFLQSWLDEGLHGTMAWMASHLSPLDQMAGALLMLFLMTKLVRVMIYGALALVFTIVVGFVLAVLMDQKIRFEDTFRTIMLYPFALSFIVTGLVWQWLLNPELGIQEFVRGLGFTGFEFDPLSNPDTVLYGLLIAGLWQGTGFVMCIMLAGLRGIDEDIWKAVRVDGIPRWKTYVFVVIPMMRPVFITTLVLVASGIIKLYDLVVAQTSGGPGNASQVPAMYVYRYMFTAQNLGQGFAASTMMLLSVLIVLIPWAYLEFGGKKNG